MSRSRSTQEVFDDHLVLRAAGQVDLDIKRNYAHDVALITLDGIFRGHDGVRECARILEDCIGDADVAYVVRRVDGDVAYLHWTARSDEVVVNDAADTFVIRDGKIVRKTIYFRPIRCDRQESPAASRDG
jgi:ketosteroid isomerase-like protein